MNAEASSDIKQLKPLERHRVAPSSSNLSLADEVSAGAEVKALFAQYRERFARTDLPGILLCFATNPVLLKGMLQIAEGFLFADSLLSRRHKEMIATFVSCQNNCLYCAGSHAVSLEALGGSAAMICALEHGDLDAQMFSSAERALLTFAEKLNRDSAAVNRADVERTMHAGWTEAQVEETVHIAALFAAFNRIANGFGLPSAYRRSLETSND